LYFFSTVLSTLDVICPSSLHCYRLSQAKYKWSFRLPFPFMLSLHKKKGLVLSFVLLLSIELAVVCMESGVVGGIANQLASAISFDEQESPSSNLSRETSATENSKRWKSLWNKRADEDDAGKSNTTMATNVVGGPFFEAAKDANIGTIGLNQLFKIFPQPTDSKTAAIYNETSYRELIGSFLRSKNGENFTIVANGGSSTAGAGGVPLENRYYTKLSHYMNVLLTGSNNSSAQQQTIQSVNRGHGARNSLHSANWMANFIPPNTDLLLWEFATNDYSFRLQNTNPASNEKSAFLAWLYEVSQIKPHPPKVLLIYLWKSPFGWGPNNKKEIQNPVFLSHGSAAREFDFVVGHVNVASYVDELKVPNCDHHRGPKCIFLSDKHHPNSFGHLTTTFLMLHLLRGEGELYTNTTAATKSLHPLQQSKQHTKYEWHCGNETEEKRIIQRAITNSVTGWRSPRGSWTLEVPMNEKIHSPRQLVLERPLGAIGIIGKQDPIRQDRTGRTEVNYCTGDPKDNTVSLAAPLEPMKNVQAILFALGTNPTSTSISELGVYVSSANTSSAGKLVTVRTQETSVEDSWPCLWTWQWTKGLMESYWFIFSEVQDSISFMSFCIANGTAPNPMMVSMVAY
jgi:hypothetical protein